jgi:hypothetical protein
MRGGKVERNMPSSSARPPHPENAHGWRVWLANFAVNASNEGIKVTTGKSDHANATRPGAVAIATMVSLAVMP